MKPVFLASLLTLVAGCGGDAFQSATHDVIADAGGAVETSPPAPPDAPSTTTDDAPSSRVDALADATSEAPSFVDVAPRDALAETITPSVDAGELVDARDEPLACDLRPCMCNGHVALCCNGPCPSGFEGLTCYCGDCRFPTHYVPDAGRCEL